MWISWPPENLQSIWFGAEVEDNLNCNDMAQNVCFRITEKPSQAIMRYDNHSDGGGRKTNENQINKINDRPKKTGRNFIWINYWIEFNRNAMHSLYGDIHEFHSIPFRVLAFSRYLSMYWLKKLFRNFRISLTSFVRNQYDKAQNIFGYRLELQMRVSFNRLSKWLARKN